LADQPSERLSLSERNRDPSVGELETDVGATEREHSPGVEDALIHSDAIDPGPVAAFEIAQDRPMILDRDLAMEARHRPIGEHEVRRLVSADDRLATRGKKHAILIRPVQNA
jgi:hypothetical protein